MKVTAVVQARMGSTRLPGKVMLPILGRPILWHVCERARRCAGVDVLVVATTDRAVDNEIAAWSNQHGIPCVRGSETDVLDRFSRALEQYPADVVVRITADSPMFSPRVVEERIRALEEFDADVTWMPRPGAVMAGESVYSRRVLDQAATHAKNPFDREHVGARYMAEHRDEFRVVEVRGPEWTERQSPNLTIDVWEEYVAVRALCERWGTPWEVVDERTMILGEETSNPAEDRVGAAPAKASRRAPVPIGVWTWQD